MATVANVYAKAVFELGQEKKQLEPVVKDLHSFQDVLTSSEALSAVLTGGGIHANVRKNILAEILKAAGVSGLAKNFVEMLGSRNRLVALPEIMRELDRMVEESQGIYSGKVQSAVELSPEEIGVLEKALSKRMGKTVRLNATVDASLLGGVVATVHGKTFDASLRSQLQRFKNELI